MSKNDKIKPSIFPGFMELLPNEQIAFNKMLSTIQESFELFGFLPLDTPLIEKAEILTAKGGEETDRQMYRFTKGDNDMILRFDLTVPLARYVAEHMHNLHFPFRRYQIGKVYRGEKPQKGRFREFYQCDIDVIDKDVLDPANDAEIVSVIYSVFSKLSFGDFVIRINNRKILTGFVKELGAESNSSDILKIIDKLEKIGKDGVVRELEVTGLKKPSIDRLMYLISLKGNPDIVLKNLEQMDVRERGFKEGVEELAQVAGLIDKFKVPSQNWEIDLTIARGLDYYTGTVYETILKDHPEIGSICSGGRYDDLAEFYTDQKLPGVGISIGLTRLFSKLNELGLFSKNVYSPSKVMLLSLDVPLDGALEKASVLRNNGISCEVYLKKDDKLKKKLDHANRIGVMYVLIIGENELKENKVTLKNMVTGEQYLLNIDEAVEKIITS